MNATRILLYVTPVSASTVLAVTAVPVQLVLADLTVKTVSTHNALIFAKYTHISVTLIMTYIPRGGGGGGGL